MNVLSIKSRIEILLFPCIFKITFCEPSLQEPQHPLSSLDWELSSYHFDLPPEFIASRPTQERSGCKLMFLPKNAGPPIATASFLNLWEFLPAGALLVLNNTRVLPARLSGKRETGGRVEYLQLTPISLLDIAINENGLSKARSQALIRPFHRISAGETLNFGQMQARVLKKHEYGRTDLELAWTGNLEEFFNRSGQIPLPPYLNRKPEKTDREDYQTIYASRTGAIAAPTAGLHFDFAHLDHLRQKGFEIAEITLHTGYGTFSPVREKDIRQHLMHREYAEISREASDAIRKAKSEGRAVIAIGTTSLRALEGAFQDVDAIGPFAGWTDIFIYPGKRLKIVDGILTNFHLPQSSLLMLVSALAGRERVLNAYEQAKSLGFRFFSYGDAMLIC